MHETNDNSRMTISHINAHKWQGRDSLYRVRRVVHVHGLDGGMHVAAWRDDVAQGIIRIPEIMESRAAFIIKLVSRAGVCLIRYPRPSFRSAVTRTRYYTSFLEKRESSLFLSAKVSCNNNRDRNIASKGAKGQNEHRVDRYFSIMECDFIQCMRCWIYLWIFQKFRRIFLRVLDALY